MFCGRRILIDEADFMNERCRRRKIDDLLFFVDLSVEEKSDFSLRHVTATPGILVIANQFFWSRQHVEIERERKKENLSVRHCRSHPEGLTSHSDRHSFSNCTTECGYVCLSPASRQPLFENDHRFSHTDNGASNFVIALLYTNLIYRSRTSSIYQPLSCGYNDPIFGLSDSVLVSENDRQPRFLVSCSNDDELRFCVGINDFFECSECKGRI